MKKYIKPEMRLSLFSVNDVITTSEGSVEPSYFSRTTKNSVDMSDSSLIKQSIDWSKFDMSS